MEFLQYNWTQSDFFHGDIRVFSIEKEQGRGTMRLFIADDSEVVRERLSTLLSQLDNVEIVGNAGTVDEAIHEIRRLKPDLVVLDIRMPGGCGIDVLRSVKGDEPSPAVIMLTNYPYRQYEERCMDAGADFFFDKSVEFEFAIEVIKGLASAQIQKRE